MDGTQGIVRRYILENFASSGQAGQITDETNLNEIGILDSVSTQTLVSFLEQRFGVRIRADDVEDGHLSSLARIDKLLKIRSGVDL